MINNYEQNQLQVAQQHDDDDSSRSKNNSFFLNKYFNQYKWKGRFHAKLQWVKRFNDDDDNDVRQENSFMFFLNLRFITHFSFIKNKKRWESTQLKWQRTFIIYFVTMFAQLIFISFVGCYRARNFVFNWIARLGQNIFVRFIFRGGVCDFEKLIFDIWGFVCEFTLKINVLASAKLSGWKFLCVFFLVVLEI